MNGTFSIQESIGFGWEKMKEHLGLFLLALLIFVSLLAGIGLTQGLLTILGKGSLAFGLVTNLVVSPLLGMGYLRLVLTAVDGGKPRLPELFSQGHLLLNWWGVM